MTEIVALIFLRRKALNLIYRKISVIYLIKKLSHGLAAILATDPLGIAHSTRSVAGSIEDIYQVTLKVEINLLALGRLAGQSLPQRASGFNPE